MEKVSLSKLQHDLLGIAWAEAKQNVDSLLDGQAILLDIPTSEIAQKFVMEVEAIGVVCEIL